MFGGYTGRLSRRFAAGQIGGGIHDQTFEGATTGRRWKMFRPFAQDDWRVTKDLTVNLGVAWALVTPITKRPTGKRTSISRLDNIWSQVQAHKQAVQLRSHKWKCWGSVRQDCSRATHWVRVEGSWKPDHRGPRRLLDFP